MSVTLAPGASLRRIAEIVRNAVLRGPDAWEGGSLPGREELGWFITLKAIFLTAKMQGSGLCIRSLATHWRKPIRG